MKPAFYTFILCFLLPFSSFTQYSVSSDSLVTYENPVSPQVKPGIHYSAGSNFLIIPRYGSVNGINASAFYSYPVSPRLTIETGLIAGRYYTAIKNLNPENKIYSTFNTLSVYGTASYQLNQKLSFYGTGIRQLAGQIPLFNLPKNSFSFGSTLNFGNFTIGAEIRMSEGNNYYSSSPFGQNQDYFQSYPW